MVDTQVARAVKSLRRVLDCGTLTGVEQFDAWTDAVSRNFVPLSADAAPENRTHFDGRLMSQEVGRVVVSGVSGNAVRVRRTAQQIARADPGHIKLGLQLQGYSVITQDGRDAALAPGDFAIYDTTRPYVLDFDSTFRMFVVMFPAEALRLNRNQLRTMTASRFSGRQGLPAIMSRFLTAMSEQLDEDALTGDLPLSDAVFDLLGATLADRMEAEGVLDERSRRRALIAQVETHIASRLGDPALSVQSVAEAHHVSIRYLQKLFEDRDETVRGWIRRRRLEESRRDLADPGLGDQQIATVGARWGFADATAFARAFRQEFGVTPSEYRATFRAGG